MRQLFDGELSPITSTIGFLESSAAGAASAFESWQRSIHKARGRFVRERLVRGSLKEVLLELLPLTSIIRQRQLFVPTDSAWCAYFDNGHQGTDAFSVMSYLAQQLGCRGMRVTAVPNTIEGEFRGARGEYGAVVLEVYGPERTHFLNYVRSISLVNDGGRWDFSAGGVPFQFEETDQYRVRRVRDRFTFELLERYLSELGLAPFDEWFYLPGAAEAVLVELKGEMPAAIREFTLEDLRSS